MQRLRAAAGARLTPLDLRQEERRLQQMVHGGEHDRQAANLLHGRIEVEQGMAPIASAGNRPVDRRRRAGLEAVAKRPDPGRRNGAAQQQKTLHVEQPPALDVERGDFGAGQNPGHGTLPAQEMQRSRNAWLPRGFGANHNTPARVARNRRPA
jgi:hypothetical protein